MARLRVRRLPRRYRSVLMSVALSVTMTAVVSFIVTVRTVGLCGALAETWLEDWTLSCAIAVPARFVVAPLVSRFVGMLLEPLAIYRG